MNSTVTAPAKIEFSAIKGDRYESHVDVHADGHYVGELYRDADEDWMPGRMLSTEMETIRHRAWSRLADAKRDVTAAAAVARNRCARLRFQRRELAAAAA